MQCHDFHVQHELTERVLAIIWNNFKEFGWIVSLIRICNCLSIYSSFWMHVCVCVAIHVSLRVKFVSKIYWIVKMYLKYEARAPVNWKKIKKFIWCTYSLFVRRFQRHFVENDELLESLVPFVMVDVSPCCVKLRFERHSPSFSSFALTYKDLHTRTHTHTESEKWKSRISTTPKKERWIRWK